MPDNNALHIAAKEGDVVQVQAQVSNFDINARGEYYGTALYWSARNGHAEAVKLLLTFNPDVKIPDVSTLKMIYFRLIYITPIALSLFYSYVLHLSIHIVITLTLSHLVVTTFYNP